MCAVARVRTIPRSIPNTQYPILLASSDTNTQYRYRYRVWHHQNNTSVSQIYFHRPMLQPQSLSPPIRRMDSLRYATSAVGEGRKRWSDLRRAFVNSYPSVCVGGGGRGRRACGWATAPPSSPRCLSATTPPPPPRGGNSQGPCQEPEDGRTRRRSLIAGGALDCTRRRRCCAVICNKYIAVTYVKFQARSRNIVLKISQRINRRKTLRLMP